MYPKADIRESSQCHLCHSREVTLIDCFTSFHRVTSDCRPLGRGGKLGVCGSCGTVQKMVDDDFLRDCRAIYESYAVYHQSEGREQRVFEQEGGQSQTRSERLLSEIFKRFPIPLQGRLLDVGCGNGGLLRTFSRLRPSWVLHGFDPDDRYKVVVEGIEHVEAFYSCEVEELPGRYDMIVLVHSLEHVPDTINYLLRLSDKLNTDGLFLVLVPNYMENPFDLIIADHCTHFDQENLKRLLDVSGFRTLFASDNCIPKEMTFLARKNARPRTLEIPRTQNSPCQNVIKALNWLKECALSAAQISRNGNFGLFGTSIAATWLFGELDGKVAFFVDEDHDRIGKSLMGRRVYHPGDLSEGCNVLIALPYPIAYDIWKRISSCRARFFLPPRFSGKP